MAYARVLAQTFVYYQSTATGLLVREICNQVNKNSKPYKWTEGNVNYIMQPLKVMVWTCLIIP